MAKKSGAKITKRARVPSFWPVARKKKKFIITTLPGPHPKRISYPLGVFIRDILKLVKTQREANSAIKDGKISVDGVIRKDQRYPVGLMDVVNIIPLKKVFRLVPGQKKPLSALLIPDDEKNLKLCKITSKCSAKSGKVQYGMHDGRNILAEDETGLKPGDVCLVEIPTQKLVRAIRTQKGVKTLVLQGERAGLQGELTEINTGTMIKKSMATVSFGTSTSKLPLSLLMTIGDEKPILTIDRGE